VQGVAEEVAVMRKETMSRIDGRVVGHGMWCGSDQAGGCPLGGGGPSNSHLVPFGTSGEESATQGHEKVSGCEKEMQRMVAEVMEGVEQMGRRMAADRSRVNLLHANTDLQLGTLGVELRRVTGEQLGGVGQGMEQAQQQLGSMPIQLKQLSERARGVDGVMSEQLRELRHVSERMEEQEAVVGHRLGEVRRQVQHCVLELDRLPAQLESVPEQLELLGQRLDGVCDEMRKQRDEMRDVRSQMVAGLGAVEEKVEEVERRVMEERRAL